MTSKELEVLHLEWAQGNNINFSDLSKIEKGLIKIQLPTVFELSSGLGVNPKVLFDFPL